MGHIWDITGRYVSQMWTHMQAHTHPEILCTKIAKNWQKIELFSRKSANYAYFERFYPKIWDINGRYTEIVAAQKLQKIAIFFNFVIQLHCKSAQKWENSGRYVGSHVCKKLQKIELFFKFTIHFQLKSAEIWDISGRYVHIYTHLVFERD